MCVSMQICVFLVVVAHKSKFQVVNIDTIFWLEDRSPLGKVCINYVATIPYIARHYYTDIYVCMCV